jgi:hypothetical protein
MTKLAAPTDYWRETKKSQFEMTQRRKKASSNKPKQERKK